MKTEPSGSPFSRRDWAPIAIFAYNRPGRLTALIESLANCRGFTRSPVVIFVDGPKNGLPNESVNAVQEIVSALKYPNIAHRFETNNRGLRNAVYAGVSELISQYGRVIVLEDDLVVSPSALEYFNAALDAYATDARIWSIVGYAYDAPQLRDATTAIALPFAHPWGWATWSQAWSKFDLDNRPSPTQLRARSFRAAFDMNGLYPFTTQLENSIEGRVNSWFIHWYYTIFQHGGASIFPPRRVVDNFGINNGSHGGRLNPYDRMVHRPPLLSTVPDLPESINIDFFALDQLKRSRELQVQRLIARAGSFKRRMLAIGEK